jgi:hypothetical protein
MCLLLNQYIFPYVIQHLISCVPLWLFSVTLFSAEALKEQEIFVRFFPFTIRHIIIPTCEMDKRAVVDPLDSSNDSSDFFQRKEPRLRGKEAAQGIDVKV